MVHAADSTPLLLDNARLEDGRSTRGAMANGNARFTRTDVGRRGNRGGASDGRTEILSSAERTQGGGLPGVAWYVMRTGLT